MNTPLLGIKYCWVYSRYILPVGMHGPGLYMYHGNYNDVKLSLSNCDVKLHYCFSNSVHSVFFIHVVYFVPVVFSQFSKGSLCFSCVSLAIAGINKQFWDGRLPASSFKEESNREAIQRTIEWLWDVCLFERFCALEYSKKQWLGDEGVLRMTSWKKQAYCRSQMPRKTLQPSCSDSWTKLLTFAFVALWHELALGSHWSYRNVLERHQKLQL